MQAQPIGRYTILNHLGKGSMSNVYLGLDPYLEREIAIKVLSSEAGIDQDEVALLQDEAGLMASFENQAIVPIYDAGIADDKPYIVMSYMSGGSLAERIKEEPLSEIESLRILQGDQKA